MKLLQEEELTSRKPLNLSSGFVKLILISVEVLSNWDPIACLQEHSRYRQLD